MPEGAHGENAPVAAVLLDACPAGCGTRMVQREVRRSRAGIKDSERHQGGSARMGSNSAQTEQPSEIRDIGPVAGKQ